MKRFMILTAAMVMASAGMAFAQKYVVVNSEKIFKSIDEYNNAITSLDEMSKQYQKEVDAKFEQIETLYNSYMAQKESLSTQLRAQLENQILTQEKEATQYQESLFGADGVIMKKRIELIQPIQSRVFSAIETYAKENGYELVLDVASNPNVLYSADSLDHSQAVINLLKK